MPSLQFTPGTTGQGSDVVVWQHQKVTDDGADGPGEDVGPLNGYACSWMPLDAGDPIATINIYTYAATSTAVSKTTAACDNTGPGRDDSRVIG